MSKLNPRRNARDIKEELAVTIDFKCSTNTVQRRLIERGLYERRPVRKSFISEKNRRNRIAVAMKHKNLTVEDWKNVIWSDESKFNRFGNDGIQYV